MLALYQMLTFLLKPLLHLWLYRRMLQGKEIKNRLPERWGRASITKPEGTLIWLHAASVGEFQAALPLIQALLDRHAAAHILITTGTATSAAMAAKWTSDRIMHQLVPIDHPAAVQRFLLHWRPTLGIWLESELWPNLVLQTHNHQIPMLLVNARISERSVERWKMFPASFKQMMGCFDQVIAASKSDAERYRNLGVSQVIEQHNIKYDAPPLAANETLLKQLRDAISQRPCWLAASTHQGEEAIVIEAHQILRQHFPDLLTIIVPRHTVRASEVMTVCQHLHVTRYSEQNVSAAHELFIADVMGEMGTFFSLCSIVLMGGSLVPIGGHNPIEPAQLGCAIMCGPHMHHFADLAALWKQQAALHEVHDAATIAQQVRHWLQDETARTRAADAAWQVVQHHKGGMQQLLHTIDGLLQQSSQRYAA